MLVRHTATVRAVARVSWVLWLSLSLILCSRDRAPLLVERGWSTAGWNTIISEDLRTRFGTLLGPEKTPGVFLQGCSWFGVPNAFVVGVVVPVSDRGVVVC